MIQWIGRHYVAHVNKTYQRSGTLWEGRFKACPVASQRYALACYRYIEMNPVRAAMVEHPGHYAWSSYCHNAGKNLRPWLAEHVAYTALGGTPESRVSGYQHLFSSPLSELAVNELRACLQTGTPLGDSRFRSEIEQALSVKVGSTRRGRPQKGLCFSGPLFRWTCRG